MNCNVKLIIVTFLYSCYTVINDYEELSHNEARLKCQQRSMHMASLNTHQEWMAIMRAISSVAGRFKMRLGLSTEGHAFPQMYACMSICLIRIALVLLLLLLLHHHHHYTIIIINHHHHHINIIDINIIIIITCFFFFFSSWSSSSFFLFLLFCSSLLLFMSSVSLAMCECQAAFLPLCQRRGCFQLCVWCIISISSI